MQKYLILSPIVIWIFLSGCYTGKTIVDIKPDGVIGVDDYTTVKQEDPVSFLCFGTTFPMGPDFFVAPGTKFQFGKFDRGILSGNIQYKFKMGGNIFDNYTSDRNVPSLHLLTTYSYPVKTLNKTGKVRIILNNSAYTVDNKSPFLRMVSFEGGLGYSISEGETDLWARQMSEENGAMFDEGFPDGNAIIHQAHAYGYVGIRLSSFINTYISGMVNGTRYSGRKKEVWDIRFGLKPLIYAEAPDILYQYFLPDSSGPIPVEEYVSVSDFLDKKFLGFHLGVSWNSFFEKKRASIAMTYYWEFGVEPGYSEKYFDTSYSRVGVMFGFLPKRKK